MTNLGFQMRRIASRAVPVTTLVAASVLVVACGSSEPPQSTQAAGTTPSQSRTTQPTQPTLPTERTPTTPAGTPRCAISDLQVWVARDQGGGAAGTQYYLIEFKNVSAHSCQLRGYPRVSADADGHQIGNPATRDGPIGVTTVTLQPGATAHSALGIANAGNFDPEACGKVTATALHVYPPNETTAVYLPLQFSACSAEGLHQLFVSPVQAGAGNPVGASGPVQPSSG